MKSNIWYKTIDIMPYGYECRLSGFGNRKHNNETLGINECNLRILMINSEETWVVFISIDALYFPLVFRNTFIRILENKIHIKPENIILTATHTHSGPQYGFFESEIIDDIHVKHVNKIFEQHMDNFNEKNCVPVRVHSYNIELDQCITVNRRRYLRNIKKLFRKDTLALPNYSSPVEDDINGLAFYNEKGDLEYITISYASHPVFNTSSKLSSDYPGEIISSLKKDKVVKDGMFFQGFGADLRPNYIEKFQISKFNYKSWIKLILYKSIFANYSKENLKHFVSVIVKNIRDNIVNESVLIDSKSFSVINKEFVLKSETGKTQKILTLQSVKFSQSTIFLSLSAEVFSDYYRLLKKTGKIVIPVSCSLGNIGYIPTVKESDLGGYEVEKAALNNGMDGRISTKCLNNLENFILDLSKM
jgi:hypothetical protein